MRVSTKIVLGYVVLVLLLVGGLGYELVLIQRMEEINRRLAAVNLEATSGVMRLDESLRNVTDFSRRFLAVGGDPYPTLFEDNRRRFKSELDGLSPLVRSEGERAAVSRLDSMWQDFIQSMDAAEAARPASGAYDSLPSAIESDLNQLELQLGVLALAVEETKESEVSLSAQTSQQAQRVSWLVAIAAVVLAGGVVLSVVRSTRGAVRRFMGATRSVAEGHFDQHLPEELNDEFGELARSFNLMARRLGELDRLKNDFVSSVSHELKSPIASSREIVQLLLDEIPGPLNTEQRRLLELSVRSSRRLSSMVGGLLDLARMDAGTITYDLDYCDLSHLAQLTLEEFEVSIQDRGLRIESAVGRDVAMVYCDRDRIVQVVENLIDNAMKFSRRGSTISVSLETRAHDDDASGEVILSVMDTGPGVADSDKARIFGKFQQVRRDGTKHQGVGLGLAISRGIVEDHGGRIWVEDNPEGGAIFRCMLPAAIGMERPERASAAGV